VLGGGGGSPAEARRLVSWLGLEIKIKIFIDTFKIEAIVITVLRSRRVYQMKLRAISVNLSGTTAWRDLWPRSPKCHVGSMPSRMTQSLSKRARKQL
jgi:hypothetical protein